MKSFEALANVDDIPKGTVITEEVFNKLPANYRVCFKQVAKPEPAVEKKVNVEGVKFPTTKWKIENIQKFMSERGIEFHPEDTTEELLEKIEAWKGTNA